MENTIAQPPGENDRAGRRDDGEQGSPQKRNSAARCCTIAHGRHGCGMLLPATAFEEFRGRFAAESIAAPGKPNFI